MEVDKFMMDVEMVNLYMAYKKKKRRTQILDLVVGRIRAFQRMQFGSSVDSVLPLSKTISLTPNLPLVSGTSLQFPILCTSSMRPAQQPRRPRHDFSGHDLQRYCSWELHQQ